MNYDKSVARPFPGKHKKTDINFAGNKKNATFAHAIAKLPRWRNR